MSERVQVTGEPEEHVSTCTRPVPEQLGWRSADRNQHSLPLPAKTVKSVFIQKLPHPGGGAVLSERARKLLKALIATFGFSIEWKPHFVKDIREAKRRSQQAGKHRLGQA